jgi:hypothetical protein
MPVCGGVICFATVNIWGDMLSLPRVLQWRCNELWNLRQATVLIVCNLFEHLQMSIHCQDLYISLLEHQHLDIWTWICLKNEGRRECLNRRLWCDRSDCLLKSIRFRCLLFFSFRCRLRILSVLWRQLNSERKTRSSYFLCGLSSERGLNSMRELIDSDGRK